MRQWGIPKDKLTHFISLSLSLSALFYIPILIQQLTLFLFFPHFIFESSFFLWAPSSLKSLSFRECCLLFIQKSLCLVRGKFHSTPLEPWVDFDFSSFCNWVFFFGVQFGFLAVEKSANSWESQGFWFLQVGFIFGGLFEFWATEKSAKFRES